MEIAATIVRPTQVGARQRIMTACTREKNRLPLGENPEKRQPASVFDPIRLRQREAFRGYITLSRKTRRESATRYN
jgi:hypothetical protein